MHAIIVFRMLPSIHIFTGYLFIYNKYIILIPKLLNHIYTLNCECQEGLVKLSFLMVGIVLIWYKHLE